jgi:LuxR family quorum-sensing system transcriptional regulator ExpR
MLDHLARCELLQVVDLSHRCVAAESYEDLRAIITTLGSLTSFDRAALCAVRWDVDVSLEHFVNHSYGEEWSRVYTSRRFDRVDPVLRHAHGTQGAFRWHDAFGDGGARTSSAFFEAARDFGLVHGMAYTCRSRASSTRTILSLASRDERSSDRVMALVRSVGPHLHEAYDRLRLCDRVEAPRGDRVELSSREREILEWTRDGKTYWEIGQIIGISQRTVKYHFARIRAKLDVVSTSHAVAKAMRIGLIE